MNGHSSFSPMFIHISLYVIVYLVFALNNNSDSPSILKNLGIVFIASFISMRMLFSVYSESVCMQDNEVIPGFFMLFFGILLIVLTLALAWFIKKYAYTKKRTESPDSTIILCFSLIMIFVIPASFKYEKTWIRQFYTEHIYEIINEAAQTNVQHCEVINNIYFWYDESNRHTIRPHRYQHYFHEKPSAQLCKQVATAVIKNDFKYCVNNSIIELVELLSYKKKKADPQDTYYYNDNRIFDELIRNDNFRDCVLCLDFYKKYHPNKGTDAENHVADIIKIIDLVNIDRSLYDHDYVNDRGDLTLPSYCKQNRTMCNILMRDVYYRQRENVEMLADDICKAARNGDTDAMVDLMIHPVVLNYLENKLDMHEFKFRDKFNLRDELKKRFARKKIGSCHMTTSRVGRCDREEYEEVVKEHYFIGIDVLRCGVIKMRAEQKGLEYGLPVVEIEGNWYIDFGTEVTKALKEELVEIHRYHTRKYIDTNSLFDFISFFGGSIPDKEYINDND